MPRRNAPVPRHGTNSPIPPLGVRGGTKGGVTSKRLVTVREDVLNAILGRLDAVQASLARIEGNIPKVEPTLRELAIRAACGTMEDHQALLDRIEREVAGGRDRADVIRDTREAL